MVSSDTPSTLRPVRASAVLNVFFCSLTSHMGWALLGLGMFLFWLSAYDVLRTRAELNRPLIAGQAIIQNNEMTYARVNRVVVMAHTYQFTHLGQTYQGRAYSTGRRLAIGMSVPVEFAPENPRISRLNYPGFRAAPHEDWIVYYVLALPGLGLLLLLKGVFKGLKLLRLLRRGHLLTARVSDQQLTGGHEKTAEGPQPIYQITLAYVVAGKTCQTRYKTWRPELIGAISPHVLSLPEQPDKAIALDAIGDRLYLDQQGVFQSRQSIGTLLLAPGLFLLLNLISLALKYAFSPLI